MLIVSAVMPIKPEFLEAFSAAAKACAEQTRRETGNISYTVCSNSEDPCQFITFEEWETAGAEAAHMQSAHLKDFIGEIRTYLGGAPTMRRYEVTGSL